jgi:hypothetical protein
VTTLDRWLTWALLLTTAYVAYGIVAVRWGRWKRMHTHYEWYRHGGAAAFFASVAVNCVLILAGAQLSWRLPVALVPAVFAASGLAMALKHQRKGR